MIDLLCVIVLMTLLVCPSLEAIDNTTTSTRNEQQQRQSFYIKRGSQFYFTRQATSHFVLSTPANNFAIVNGLSLVINHNRPCLYEVRFQGNLVVYGGRYRSYVRIMIDDRILIFNKLYLNNEDRKTLDPFFQNDLLFSDWQDGIYLTMRAPGLDTTCTKLETVYLSAGAHNTHVVARTEQRVIIHTVK